MTNRTTITLDDEAYGFLMTEGGSNKSAYINTLLKKKKQVTLDEAVLKANQEEAQDQAYHEELAVWDETLTDGLT